MCAAKLVFFEALDWQCDAQQKPPQQKKSPARSGLQSRLTAGRASTSARRMVHHRQSLLGVRPKARHAVTAPQIELRPLALALRVRQAAVHAAQWQTSAEQQPVVTEGVS